MHQDIFLTIFQCINKNKNDFLVSVWHILSIIILRVGERGGYFPCNLDAL